MVRRGRAVLPEKNAVNQDGFAGALNSDDTMRICPLAMRFVELVAPVVCLVLLPPMLLLLAIAIRLESRGPIFVRETRTDTRTEPFKFAVASGDGMFVQATPQFTSVSQLLHRRTADAHQYQRRRNVHHRFTSEHLSHRVTE